jgi:hypothetical protein
MSEGLNSEILEQLSTLRKLIGKVVFLHIPLGTKAPNFTGWQNVTLEATLEADYQCELKAARTRGGNLGVKLGPDSGRLFTLDVDSDQLQADWIKRIPWLEQTLSTKGERGCQFWLQLEEGCDYPAQGVVILKEGVVKIGELRFGGGSRGAQSVIWGVHPCGERYRIIKAAPPLVIGLADLDELGYRPAEEPAQEQEQPRGREPEPDPSLEARIRTYLDTCEASVAGQNGDDMLFKVVCKLVLGWDLSPESDAKLFTTVSLAQTNSPPLQDPLVRELEVVVLEDKKNRGGRPLRLTETRFRRMLGLIRDGNTNSAACRIEGINYVTWRDHIRQKPEWGAALAEAEKVRDEIWRDHALEMVKSAMPRNWVAAMTYLERKYPNEFALRTVNRNINSAEVAVGDQVPEARLLEYSKQMAEFARANEPKAEALPEALGDATGGDLVS